MRMWERYCVRAERRAGISADGGFPVIFANGPAVKSETIKVSAGIDCDAFHVRELRADRRASVAAVTRDACTGHGGDQMLH